jgi:hypothetical protein
MATEDRGLSRLRQPEYTGENRCLPCTVVNSLIAVAAALALAVAGTVVVGPLAGAGAGVAVAGVSAGAIYLRGYLVPGTPKLTKQYFPPWLLALFGKAPATHEYEPVETDHGIDPEATLVAAGALEECADSEDLCLTDQFRQAWSDELDTLEGGEASRDQLLALLDVDTGEVEYEEFGRAFRARVNGQVVGKWESEAAFLADLAAARVFDERDPNRSGYPVEVRGQLLNGLRLFVDTCPSCGGKPQFGAETVESCCSSFEVAAVTCPDCEARLFESPVDV